MPHWFEYISPAGTLLPVEFDPNARHGPYMLLRNPTGLSSLGLQSHSRKGTRRVGEDLRALTKGIRTIAMQVAVLGDDEDQYWSRREELVEVLNLEGPPHTALRQGLLRFHRPNKPTLELDVVPNGPEEASRPDDYSVVMDIEFEAVSPHWRETADTKRLLQASESGMEFPLEHPWESISASSTKEVVNGGTVAVPVRLTIYGSATDPIVANETYDEGIYLTGDVLDGERVEINTTPGSRRVEHIATDGKITNWMGNVDMANSTFWFLRQGLNRVRFDASTISGGYAGVYWRNAYGGI